jgi:ribosomal subunit interface protein
VCQGRASDRPIVRAGGHALKVQIRERDIKVTEVMRAHVERRLGLALGRFAGRIGPVTVHFSENDGSKHCQIDVGLRPRKVRARDAGADLLVAFNYASDRVSSSVARALDREQDWANTRPRPPGESKT